MPHHNVPPIGLSKIANVAYIYALMVTRVLKRSGRWVRNRLVDRQEW